MRGTALYRLSDGHDACEHRQPPRTARVCRSEGDGWSVNYGTAEQRAHTRSAFYSSAYRRASWSRCYCKGLALVPTPLPELLCPRNRLAFDVRVVPPKCAGERVRGRNYGIQPKRERESESDSPQQRRDPGRGMSLYNSPHVFPSRVCGRVRVGIYETPNSRKLQPVLEL